MNTNLLDLNNDVLNIIGDFVKKGNANKMNGDITFNEYVDIFHVSYTMSFEISYTTSFKISYTISFKIAYMIR